MKIQTTDATHPFRPGACGSTVHTAFEETFPTSCGPDGMGMDPTTYKASNQMVIMVYKGGSVHFPRNPVTPGGLPAGACPKDVDRDLLVAAIAETKEKLGHTAGNNGESVPTPAPTPLGVGGEGHTAGNNGEGHKVGKGHLWDVTSE